MNRCIHRVYAVRLKKICTSNQIYRHTHSNRASELLNTTMTSSQTRSPTKEVMYVTAYFDLAKRSPNGGGSRGTAFYLEHARKLVSMTDLLTVITEPELATSIHEMVAQQHQANKTVPRITIIPMAFESLELVQTCLAQVQTARQDEGRRQRTARNDRVAEYMPEYFVCVASKFSLLQKAMQLHPLPTHFAWVDFGVFHLAERVNPFESISRDLLQTPHDKIRQPFRGHWGGFDMAASTVWQDPVPWYSHVRQVTPATFFGGSRAAVETLCVDALNEWKSTLQKTPSLEENVIARLLLQKPERFELYFADYAWILCVPGFGERAMLVHDFANCKAFPLRNQAFLNCALRVTTCDEAKLLLAQAGLTPTEKDSPELKSTVDRLVHFHPKDKDEEEKKRQQAFVDRYNHQWGFGSLETKSGPGSERAFTQRTRQFIGDLIQRRGIRSILDAPCGDFNWQHMIPGFDLLQRYTGIDIVPALAPANRARAAELKLNSSTTTFETRDICKVVLPRHDLIIARHVLMHLPLQDSIQALKNFKASGSRWLLTTTYDNPEPNANVPHAEWFRINLRLPPFSLPEPSELFVEDATAPAMCLGLWSLADLALV